MDKLNYFSPYQSKSDWHEDNLTRAFLVVIRYSPNALLHFFDYVLKELKEIAAKQNPPIENPIDNTIDLNFKEIEIHTQVGDLRNATVGKLISVLITDMNLEREIKIEASDRNARYDGLISINNELTLFIENKPNSYNVWDGQLSPALKDIKDDIQLVPIPSILKWSNIILIFNKLYNSGALSYQENLLFSDFFDYIDTNFPQLNPYDNYSLCKNNFGLLKRRTKNILEGIANEGFPVQYSTKFNFFYIETKLQEVTQAVIETVYNPEKPSDWQIVIRYFFGEKMPEARKFYSSTNYNSMSELLKKDWSMKSNLNLSYVSTKLVWLESKNEEKYFDYWSSEGRVNIHQFDKYALSIFLEKLHEKGIIIFDKINREEFNIQFINTKRSSVNINPACDISYSIPANIAIEKDRKGILVQFIKDKMREGISIIDNECKFIKR